MRKYLYAEIDAPDSLESARELVQKISAFLRGLGIDEPFIFITPRPAEIPFFINEELTFIGADLRFQTRFLSREERKSLQEAKIIEGLPHSFSNRSLTIVPKKGGPSDEIKSP